MGFLWPYPPFPVSVAAGVPIARHPPHGPVLVRLTHTVLTLDAWRRSLQMGTRVGHGLLGAGLRVAPETVPKSNDSFGYVVEFDATTVEGHGSGIGPGSSRCQEQHDLGNIPEPLIAAIVASPPAVHAFGVAVLR